MKKSCIVVTSFYEGQVGYLDFIYRLKAISKNYNAVIIGSFFPDLTELTELNCEFITIPSRKGRLGWLHYLFKVSRLIKSKNPDVVVLLHSTLSPITLLLKNENVSLYWNEHPTHIAKKIKGRVSATNIVRYFIRSLLFKGARSCRNVMVIGEAHYDDLLANGCTKDQLNLIYMGVSDSFKQPSKQESNNKEDVLHLLYIGTVSKARGRDIMLEAIAKANVDMIRAKLTIVGASKDQFFYCNEYAKKLGISNEISVFERVSSKEVPTWLLGADFGLCLWEDQPWWQFNPPTKLFEYLVAGVPVLVSNIRTHTKYIKDWHTGIVFEYNSESLSQKIIESYQKKSELSKLKTNAAIEGEKFLWTDIEPVFLSTLERFTVEK